MGCDTGELRPEVERCAGGCKQPLHLSSAVLGDVPDGLKSDKPDQPVRASMKYNKAGEIERNPDDWGTVVSALSW